MYRSGVSWWIITLLHRECSYLSSVFWSHCKRTTASLSCPDYLKSCYIQMLRSFRLRAGGTVVGRLHAIQQRNSVSTRKTWAPGGVNPVRHYRKRSPSANSPRVSEEKKRVMTWEPWLCFVRGSLCVGRNVLPDECMRLTGSPVNNATAPRWLRLRHIRFWQGPSQPANQRQMRLCTSLPTIN